MAPVAVAPTEFKNPYRPGAGHMPPYLAGREDAFAEFARLLDQDVILDNMVLTGLRGVGKTVLLDKFKPKAINAGWLWVGADLSETASLTEANLAQRLLTDLSIVTSSYTIEAAPPVGFRPDPDGSRQAALDYRTLERLFSDTPGLIPDKLRGVLEYVSTVLASHGRGRVVFAYDEAQNLSDHAENHNYPLSMLLDIFQSLQKREMRFMLVLSGLPTLLPKLVDARTFSERMFRVVKLGRLSEQASRDAIERPLEVAEYPVRFTESSIRTIMRQAAGYPYFIQFICREVFDVFIQQIREDEYPAVPVESIQRKLDTDFFSGPWARTTDRQQQLLWVIANLDDPEGEFTISEIVERASAVLDKGFSRSHISQMLTTLTNRGLIYKHRFGRYSFAVPLMAQFISRNYDGPTAE